MNIPNHGPNRIKGALLSLTFDAPAKTAIQSFTLYIGFYGVLVVQKKARHVGKVKKVIKLYIPII